MKLNAFARAALLAAGCAVALPALAADKPVLEVWTMSLSPKFDGYFKDLVGKYNAQNPNVEVKWTDYPWDVIQSKFTAAVGAGKPRLWST
ncbi:extracellular solute-binding protein [Chromobacterium haemolyticum]|uniref:extracellular solute-binding protein n=1 Tax=Chromobacterium haemolyticum TaxID=394935 RepID=UPI0029540195|nr:extracellular solute-binding protein [Chromobacterium haemolyticum]WON82193.1 extracellular solute-binding protein [Chromobacterium haemolyticum]